MTLFTYGVLIGAIGGVVLGFVACALLSAGGEDDAASIERWERCREHLREEVES